MAVVVTINSIGEFVMGSSTGAPVCGSSGVSVMISSSFSTDSIVVVIISTDASVIGLTGTSVIGSTGTSVLGSTGTSVIGSTGTSVISSIFSISVVASEMVVTISI